MSFCTSLRNVIQIGPPSAEKMTSCRFSRWRLSAILDFKGPIMGSLKSPCTTFYMSSLATIALNCLVFEKIAFFCTSATGRQTDKQTNTNKQMDSTDALSRSRYCERRLNNEERFRSIQQFKDNAVNPCIESTYKFIDHVISQLKQMHDGIQQLSVYHVGGDEVAEGAWSLSPACQHLKQHHRQSGAISSADLKTYFIERSSC